MAAWLTDEDHQHFLEHGWVLVKGLLPRETIDQALSVFVPAETGTPDTFDLTEEEFRATLENARCEAVYEAVSELFGGAPFEHSPWRENKYRPVEPDAEQKFGAHYDLFYPTIMPDRVAVGCFGFLTDVEPGGGNFMLVDRSPLSYRYRGVERGADNYWTTPIELELNDALEELIVEAGDVFLYSYHIIHSGSKNVAGRHPRHALVTQFVPESRLVPAERPTDELSTIERANSLRYLSETFGCEFRLPEVPDTEGATEAIGAGIHVGEGLLAAAVSRFDGTTWLSVTTTDEPSVIKFLASSDLVTFKETGRLAFDEEVVGLHTDARYNPLLFVVTASGTHVHSSAYHTEWRRAAVLEGIRVGRPHFVLMGFAHDHIDAPGHTDTFPHVPIDDPCRIDLRFRTHDQSTAELPDIYSDRSATPKGELIWRRAPTWTGNETILVHDGTTFTDVQILPVNEGRRFALVAEVATDGQRTIHVSLSPKGDSYAAGLAPLPTNAPSAPRNLRLYERARGYWLVTYLRDHTDGARLHWGTVDWDADTPTLVEVTTADQLRTALATVGLR